MVFERQISLYHYNTFHIDVKARYLMEIEEDWEIDRAVEFARDYDIPILVLGRGSNMLFLEDVECLIVVMRTQGIEIVERTEDFVRVRVAGGEPWEDFVRWASGNGFGGVENLALIPGNVGSAPVQNIGAYGAEAKDVIESVEVYSLEDGSKKTFSNAECRFGYRDSIFKGEAAGRYLITYVTFRLSCRNHSLRLDYGNIRDRLSQLQIEEPTVEDIRRVVEEIRKEKLPDPEQVGSAGSFFKNPVIDPELFEELKEEYPDLPGYPSDGQRIKIPAGWLIDRAGWKGYRKGDAGVHPNQALVLVNYGKATGTEILDLCNRIRQDVWDKFSIVIDPEVNLIANASFQ